jgi:hypothetical protein
MPLHDYVKRIYEDVNDSSYVIRFLGHIINKRYKRVEFRIKGHTVIPLITGVLEDVKTKERYHSLAEFYSKATGIKTDKTNLKILKEIHVTDAYDVMRIICNVEEEDILRFFDQKYRSFLMYRDVRKRIKHYASIDVNKTVKLRWKDVDYELGHTEISCEDEENPYKCYELLEAYEKGFIEGLYYHSHKGLLLIADA